MKNLMISVIMNCYNSDTYLDEAVKSVLNQTYKNWELIFWDNQSTDNSSKIIKSFNDNRIKYFYAPYHSKLYESRNNAINKSSGDFITFLDCDDIWLSNKLELQLSRFDNDINLVYGNYELIDKYGDKIKSKKMNIYSGNITNKLFRNNFISIGSIMIRRNLMINSMFDSSYNLLGDFELWIRLSLNNKFIAINSIVEQSRVHDTNTSKLMYSDWLDEKRRFYLKFIKNNNFIYYYRSIFYIIRTETRALYEYILRVLNI